MARLGAVAGALAIVAALLSGCMPAAPTGPPQLTPEDVTAVRQAEARAWWEGMFPGREMPLIEVVEEMPSEDRMARVTECLEDAAIPGVTIRGVGEWTFDELSPSEATELAALEHWWMCAMQYPVRLADTVMMSERQLDWIYDFYVERYQPCLASFGFGLFGLPTKEDFLRDSIGYPVWYPYQEWISPIPTAPEWELLAQRCPVPEILEPYVGVVS